MFRGGEGPHAPPFLPFYAHDEFRELTVEIQKPTNGDRGLLGELVAQAHDGGVGPGGGVLGGGKRVCAWVGDEGKGS